MLTSALSCGIPVLLKPGFILAFTQQLPPLPITYKRISSCIPWICNTPLAAVLTKVFTVLLFYFTSYANTFYWHNKEFSCLERSGNILWRPPFFPLKGSSLHREHLRDLPPGMGDWSPLSIYSLSCLQHPKAEETGLASFSSWCIFP